jgi:hypothetical protein
MSTQIGILGALLALVLAGGSSVVGGAEGDKVAEEAKASVKQVQDELTKLKGEKAKVEAITEAPLNRVFPKHVFCSVHFRRYPVAMVAPHPLAASSLYAVPRGKDGKPQLLTSPEKLEAFFKSEAVTARNAEDAKEAVRAWLGLAQVLEQDGFYKFELLEDSLKVTAAADGQRASGRVIVKAGGNGDITATLFFDAEGKFTKAEYAAKLKPGPRPRCQATKLLDPDPIVRAMAEDGLLYMGSAAREYLEEQRAKAAPELQAAIDRIWRRICEQEK